MLLCGRKHCLFSTLQSVHANDLIHYHFSDNLKAQCTYVANHAGTITPVPRMPHRMKQNSFQAIQLILPSDPNKPRLAQIHKLLPGLRCAFFSANSVCFHSSSASNAYCFNASIAEEFVKVTNKHASCNTSFAAASNNATGALDNSANVHVLKDRSLFVSDISPSPIGVNVGTVVVSTPPQGVGTARIYWTDKNNVRHALVLQDALYYPVSPANVVSITKLGLDNDDMLLNIQTFPTQSMFT